MNPLSFIKLVLQPSASSIIGCLGISGLITAGAALTNTIRSGLINDLLFGTDSSPELVQQSRVTFDAFNNNVFGNPVLNKILFFGFWMAIGLIVYLIISAITQGVESANDAAQEMSETNSNSQREQREFRQRVVLRIIAAVFWVLYITVFFKYLLPFGVLSGRIAGGNITELSGWLYGLAGFAVMAIGLHFHIVFARLLMLRPRLTGAVDDIIEGEVHDHNL